jgi:hypothetical protein
MFMCIWDLGQTLAFAPPVLTRTIFSSTNKQPKSSSPGSAGRLVAKDEHYFETLISITNNQHQNVLL